MYFVNFLVLFSCVEGEQLEDAVMKQIEYYFSRQNLATDAYLVSQMDSDMWVPISTIAGFKVNTSPALSHICPTHHSHKSTSHA